MPTYSKSKSLDSQQWYIGLLTRASIEPYLKKEGDFVVRTSEKMGTLEFVVSVRGPTKIAHYGVCYVENEGWSLNMDQSKAFPSVVDLVAYYQANNLPNGITLKYPVKRPKWYLKHEHLSYDVTRDLLGTGNFCDVYKGRLNIHKPVAIKICHGPNAEKGPEDLLNAEKAKESLIKEGSLMAGYKHPNIIKFYGICCDRPPLCIVMERCNGGSLLNHLINFGDQIQTGERVRFALEAATGMSYLEEKNCVHRDLAARNCLISKFGVVKIADFGLSKVVTELAGEKFEKQGIPLRWMAPETIRRNPEYSSKSDVWSFGILVFEIFNNGGKPWPDVDFKQIARFIKKGPMVEMPEKTPQMVKSLVAECWKINVAQRCNFAYAVKRLTEIQKAYPPPLPKESTVAKIPNVIAMSKEDIEILSKDGESEDENIGGNSIYLNPKSQPTIDEEVAMGSTRKRKGRKKKIHSMNSEESLDVTRATVDTEDIEQESAALDKVIKKNHEKEKQREKEKHRNKDKEKREPSSMEKEAKSKVETKGEKEKEIEKEREKERGKETPSSEGPTKCKENDRPKFRRRTAFVPGKYRGTLSR